MSIMKGHGLANAFIRQTSSPLRCRPTPSTLQFYRAFADASEPPPDSQSSQTQESSNDSQPQRPPPSQSNLEFAHRVARSLDLSRFARTRNNRRSRPATDSNDSSSRQRSYIQRLAERSRAGPQPSPSSSSSVPPSPLGPSNAYKKPVSYTSIGGLNSQSNRQLAEEILADADREHRYVPPEPNIRLGPSAGRSVSIDMSSTMTAARMFATVERACRLNAVKQDERKQRFHVRRGQMRKNLKMIRWRRRFKDSFSAAVGRILRMKAQGW